jgi:hypothetical protein
VKLPMQRLNSNDYKILESIVDREKNRGLAKGRGSTLKQIVEKTQFSDVKVRNTLKVLLELNYISEGVKKVKAKSYYLTEDGLRELVDLRKNITL